MENDLNKILLMLRGLLPYIKDKYNVASLEAFGSYARNEQGIDSDLDLLVSFSKVPGLIKFIELKYFLSDELRIKVDLVMKESLKPGIGENVFSKSISI